jgi:uncharacterized protein (TIGR00251 family)
MQVHALVKPGRKRESLGWDGERLVVVVQAPPVEGAANERLVVVLADWLGLGKSQVAVVKGWTSHHKTLEIGVAGAAFALAVELLPRVPRQDQLF